MCTNGCIWWVLMFKIPLKSNSIPLRWWLPVVSPGNRFRNWPDPLPARSTKSVWNYLNFFPRILDWRDGLESSKLEFLLNWKYSCCRLPNDPRCTLRNEYQSSPWRLTRNSVRPIPVFDVWDWNSQLWWVPTTFEAILGRRRLYRPLILIWADIHDEGEKIRRLVHSVQDSGVQVMFCDQKQHSEYSILLTSVTILLLLCFRKLFEHLRISLLSQSSSRNI